MRRFAPVMLLVSLLVAAAPSSGDSGVIEGYAAAPAASPSPARALYRLSNGQVNGTVGYVAPLEPSSVARAFTLTPGDRAIGLVNLDAWFYTEIAGAGEPCPREAVERTGGGETGVVCPGAQWVVVVLFYGADTDFTLTIA